MEELRRILAAGGFAEVETFIASGNVLFSSPGRDQRRLEGQAERSLAAALGYSVDVFVRTRDELARVVAHRPCRGNPEDAGGAVYILFLKEPLDAAAPARLQALDTPGDQFSVLDREVYWCRHGKLSESTVKDAQLGRAIGVSATNRKRTTVVRMLERLDAEQNSPGAQSRAVPPGRKRKGSL